ncbi:hypothetical protein B0H14DRAFT_2583143 [Mycena olivaceomarginata]|nr:hypothetical protein B0H14DRAFT_2583143 [Mycena olivaceomarginata]
MSCNSAVRRTETAGMVCNTKAGKLQREVRIHPRHELGKHIAAYHQGNQGQESGEPPPRTGFKDNTPKRSKHWMAVGCTDTTRPYNQGDRGELQTGYSKCGAKCGSVHQIGVEYPEGCRPRLMKRLKAIAGAWQNSSGLWPL